MQRVRLAALCGGVCAALVVFGCVGSIGDEPDVSGGAGDPGRVTIHRLNRAEYNNTVRDLLGTKLRPADDFPNDDSGYGFDNIADVLSMSSLSLELYERAAEMLAAEAMALPMARATSHFEAEELQGSGGKAVGNAWTIVTSGEVATSVKFSAAGRYRVAAKVWQQAGGDEPAKTALLINGVPIGQFDVPNTADDPIVVDKVVEVLAGNNVVTVQFLNDYSNPAAQQDRNLFVDWIEVEGPIGAPEKNEQRDRIVTCDPASGDGCIRQVVSSFARRAWRRPATAEEITRLLSLVNLAKTEGDDVNEGLKLAVHAALVSPHFLFRVEIDPEPLSAQGHALNSFELASRLSYFLWSSMPDEQLLAAAEEGRLSDEGELRAIVQRMLDDPRSLALVENFAGQWLYTRALDDHRPDYATFPDFDEGLREAMKKETSLFFREFLDGEKGLDEMLTADFTYVNARLAKHYGLPPAGEGFERVTLPGGTRGGLLTQGSLLTVTSHPTRTSPVKRGRWVLSQLLCAEPPPPPAGVEGLSKPAEGDGTVRDQLEAHRKEPACASCHAAMDPIGFALENYDGIGAFRTEDNESAIDTSGALPTGEEFDGAGELSSVLGADPRFARCATRKLFTYALGRGPTPGDEAVIEKLAGELSASGYRLRELIALIVTSEPFRRRRGEPSTPGSLQ